MNKIIIRNSIRQILRTPLKTAIFLMLIVFSGALVTVGAGLWTRSQVNLKEYEESFITIGTVEQKASSIRQDMVWDAEKKNFIIRQEPEYSYIYPVSSLHFQGAGYTIPPEKRSYYASYTPEYQLVSDHNTFEQIVLVAEFSPLEDCIPNESVNIRINKVLGGNKNLEGTMVWFCSHNEQFPQQIYKDKTYIAYMVSSHWMHGEMVTDEKRGLEYNPIALTTSQYDQNGALIEDSLQNISAYYEVVPSFYETKEGKRYLNFIGSLALQKKTFPVTGTCRTILLMPFYNGDAYITDGRDISDGEYEKGETVCLVSETFAQNNNLAIGDTVNTRLYYTNSRNAASENFGTDGSQAFNFNILNAGGETPKVFEESGYRIVGIYSTAKGAGLSRYGMAGDEMIVPANSIKRKDNILAYSAMQGNTSSFQIPNGSVESFMEELGKNKIANLEIQFYDKGYSSLKSGIDKMRYMSLLLCAVGILICVSLLALYNYLFISKQQKRIAIERCMGIPKRKCMISMLTGMFLVLVLGTLLGCGAGAILSNRITKEDFNHTIYDTTYSNTNISTPEGNHPDTESDFHTTLMVFISCSVSMTFWGTGMGIYKTSSILKSEPMDLLAGEK